MFPGGNGIVRAARRPQLGFLSVAGETALEVFLKNQFNLAYSMTIFRLFMLGNRDYVALTALLEDRISAAIRSPDAFKFTYYIRAQCPIPLSADLQD
jgi:hypothetical protein